MPGNETCRGDAISRAALKSIGVVVMQVNQARLGLCLLVLAVLVGGCIQPEKAALTISGTVTTYVTGEAMADAEVIIFTYEQPSFAYLPPLGETVVNTTTDARGRYELRIPPAYRGERIVVFCHAAPEGWAVLTLNDSIRDLDLIVDAPFPESEVPLVLLTLQAAIQTVLDRMDTDLATAAEQLARTGLESDETRVILNELCEKHLYVIDCCTVDQTGTILVVEPDAYQESEGRDISDQKHVIQLHETQKPVLSRAFRAVEGFDAAALQWPVFAPDGELSGSASMLIRPESLLATVIAPAVQGFPVDLWVMQPDGLILYDPDREEIGRNLFTDPLYQPYPELLALGTEIAANTSGSGSYTFLGRGMSAPVEKSASWVTVGLHGTDWRVVATQVVVGDASAVHRGLPELGLLSTEAALRALTQNDELQRALVAGDRNETLDIFQQFYETNPGLYAIQWADASCINRFGYPEENSLTNYDCRTGRTPASERLVTAIEAREATSFEAPLVEGNTGRFVVAPLYAGDEYLGVVYTIQLVA
ncbi:MAG: hypothetical protein JW945_06110 [Methanomicrobia archaeon]|nr:hypothetical protein [Methanomicrobia archaeon]